MLSSCKNASEIVSAKTTNKNNTSTAATQNSAITTQNTIVEFSKQENKTYLRVTLNKGSYAPKEKVIVTILVRNYNKEAITFVLPSTTEKMHFEVKTTIKAENDKYFIDADTYGKMYTDAIKTVTLDAGESFTQKLVFIPGYVTGGSWEYIDKADITYFPKGTYNGSATFRWNNKGITDGYSITLDFPVYIL